MAVRTSQNQTAESPIADHQLGISNPIAASQPASQSAIPDAVLCVNRIANQTAESPNPRAVRRLVEDHLDAAACLAVVATIAVGAAVVVVAAAVVAMVAADGAGDTERDCSDCGMDGDPIGKLSRTVGNRVGAPCKRSFTAGAAVGAADGDVVSAVDVDPAIGTNGAATHLVVVIPVDLAAPGRSWAVAMRGAVAIVVGVVVPTVPLGPPTLIDRGHARKRNAMAMSARSLRWRVEAPVRP